MKLQGIIVWANVDLDLCRHMVFLGHNELMELGMGMHGRGGNPSKNAP